MTREGPRHLRHIVSSLNSPGVNVHAEKSQAAVEGRQDGMGDVVRGVEPQRCISQQGRGATDQLDEGKSWGAVDDDVRHSFPCLGLLPGVYASPLPVEGENASKE